MEMNDRDLLKLAAKALHAQPLTFSLEGFSSGSKKVTEPLDVGDIESWDPLADTLQAFRLAKHLNLPLTACESTDGRGRILHGYVDAHFARETYDGGPSAKHAATRRAIVRAAAEIGKNMGT